MAVNAPDIIHGVLNDDLDEIKAALKNNPSCINQQNEDEVGDTPAMLATRRENAEILKFIIAQDGFDKEKFNNEDVCISDTHCLTKNEEIAEIAYSPFEPTLEEEIEAVWEEAKFKEKVVRQKHSLKGVGTPSIIKGVLSNDFSKVKGELRKDQSSINAKDVNGLTPAMHAAKLGNVEMLKFLSNQDEFNHLDFDNEGNLMAEYGNSSRNFEITSLTFRIQHSPSNNMVPKPKF